MTARLVSIIGPPASGKTTLAEWLAGAMPARFIREDYKGNPYLADSYLRRGEFALHSQLYFLFSRLSQLNLRTWPAGGLAVTDYGFCQDRIYAACNLSGADMALYRRLADGAERLVKAPDALVHLDADEDLLLERIVRRGRSFERIFTAEYLASLRRAYRQATAEMPWPVVAVDVGTTDLLADGPRRELLERVREALR